MTGSRPLPQRLVAAAAVASLAATALGAGVLGTAVAAAADTPRQDAVLARLKQRGDTEVARRLATLDQLSSVVSQAKHLTSADRTTLTTLVTNDRSGLQALKTKIDGDADVTTARTDVQSIVTQFRIYVLVVPQVHLVRAVDVGQDAVTALNQAATKLDAAIAQVKTAGRDVTAAQAAVDDLKAKTADASKQLAPVVGEVEALAPAQWPGAHTTLQSARQSVNTARQDLQAARDDAKKAVAALKQ